LPTDSFVGNIATGGMMAFAVGPVGLQEIMPNVLRGQAGAVFLFLNAGFAYAFGPTAVAFLTEYVFKDSSRTISSISLAALTSLIIAVMLLLAGLKPYRRTIDQLNSVV
jgi:hypothetical protein